MLLRELLALRKSINGYRRDMYELAEKKGFSDPEVIKVSQVLERKITMWQKLIYEIHPLPTEKSLQ